MACQCGYLSLGQPHYVVDSVKKFVRCESLGHCPHCIDTHRTAIIGLIQKNQNGQVKQECKIILFFAYSCIYLSHEKEFDGNQLLMETCKLALDRKSAVQINLTRHQTALSHFV
jgi:hypothetical protein